MTGPGFSPARIERLKKIRSLEIAGTLVDVAQFDEVTDAETYAFLATVTIPDTLFSDWDKPWYVGEDY